MFRKYVLPRLVYFLYRLWTSTWRIQIVEPPDLQAAKRSGRRLIFAHWHRDEMALVHFVTSYRIATMTSTSSDGQLIDYVIRRLGGATSKGSSTRGGSGALKGLVRLVKSGYRASMAVDGPRGPIFKVKPGVVHLSSLAEAWIAPTGVAISSYFVFRKSWNQARLPKPFAKIIVSFTPLLKFDSADSRNPQAAAMIAQQINLAGELSDRRMRGESC